MWKQYFGWMLFGALLGAIVWQVWVQPLVEPDLMITKMYCVYSPEYQIGINQDTPLCYQLHDRQEQIMKEAQSGIEGTKEQIVNPQVTEKTETVTFGDNAGKDEPAVMEKAEEPISLLKGTDPYPDQGLRQVVSRPYLVSTITWSGTSATGALIQELDFPDLLFVIPNIIEKLNRFQFFRSPVRLSFRINGTSMHFGSLLICWVPHYRDDGENSYFQSIYTASNLDSSILSANTNKVVDIEIPYLAPSKYLNLGNATGDTAPNQGFIGHVAVFVLAPLRLIASGTTPSVSISVYAHFSDPEVAGLGLRADTLLKTAQSGEASAKTNAKSIGSEFSRKQKKLVKQTVTDLSSVATGMLTSFLDTGFGFLMDKPTSKQMITKVSPAVSQSGLQYMNGADNAEVLAASVENSVANDTAVFLKAKDYNRFENYKGLPSLLAVGSWDGSSSEGAKILEIPVDPMYVPSATVSTNRFYYLTHLANLASFFAFWTGSVKYTIQLYTSKFISGRVVIKWIPDPTYTGSINNDEFGDTVSHVLDFTGDTVYSFTIPYLQQQGWQRTNTLQEGTDTSPITTWAGRNGQWIMSVVNQLVLGNSTGTAEVFYAVWVSGGPDFRVARPTSLPSNYADGTVPPSAQGIRQKKKQIKEEIKPSKQEIVEKKNRTLSGFIKIAQSSEPITEATNMRALFEQPFPTLIPSTVTVKKDINMGEEVTSFSEMMRRYTYSETKTGTGASSYNFSINPWDFSITQISPLQRAARTFHYHRGGWRYKLQRSGNLSTTWEVETQNSVNGESASGTTQDGFTGWDIQQLDPMNIHQWIEVQTPFYADVDMHCNVKFYDAVATSKFDERLNLPVLATRWTQPDTSSQDVAFNVWLSVADDWSQGWPVTPVVLVRSTA